MVSCKFYYLHTCIKYYIDLLRWMRLYWKVYNTRNNFTAPIRINIKQKNIKRISKEFNRDIVCIIDKIYVKPYIIIYLLLLFYWTKVIIHHINVDAYPPRTLTIFFFKKSFIRIANLYICIILVNIRNTCINFEKYFQTGLTHLNNLDELFVNKRVSNYICAVFFLDMNWKPECCI